MTISQLIVTILSTVAGSSAVFAFLQFLIERKDRRQEQFNILKKDLEELSNHIDRLSDRIDKSDAVNARTRILRASDEMRRGMAYSQEFYDQLHDDINMYDKYCETHKNFKNNKAVNAIKNINKSYQKALQENDFL